jgi:hypothetical protein
MPTRSRRVLSVAAAALALLAVPNAARAGAVSGVWDIPFVRKDYTVPPVTAGEAITYLNEQRAANGIPGTLVEDAELSQGCLNHVSKYVPAKAFAFDGTTFPAGRG